MKTVLCGLLLVNLHANAIREVISISMTASELQQLRFYIDDLVNDASRDTLHLEASLICVERINDSPHREELEVDHMQPEEDCQTIKQKKRIQKLEARENMRRMWQRQQGNRNFNTTYHSGKR
jgi:hypothetical protein